MLPCVGALQRVAGNYPDVYAHLGTNQLAGDVVNAVLDVVPWPTAAQGSIYTRRVDRGNTSFNSHLGALAGEALRAGSGGEAANALSIIDIACQAEAGRCYDDHGGNIVFEDRYHRTGLKDRRAARVMNPEDVVLFQPATYQEAIINEVRVDGTRPNAGGLGVVTYYQDDQAPPRVVDVPARAGAEPGHSSATFLLEDSSADFVASVQDVLHNAPDGVLIVGGPTAGGDIRVDIYNTLDNPIQVTITSISAQPYTYAHSGLIKPGRLIHYATEASIRLYGRQPATYPLSFINVDDEILDHLTALVKIHNGVQEPDEDDVTGAEGLFRIDATVTPWHDHSFLSIRVSDLIRFNDVGGFDQHTMFVDEVVPCDRFAGSYPRNNPAVYQRRGSHVLGSRAVGSRGRRQDRILRWHT